MWKRLIKCDAMSVIMLRLLSSTYFMIQWVSNSYKWKQKTKTWTLSSVSIHSQGQKNCCSKTLSRIELFWNKNQTNTKQIKSLKVTIITIKNTIGNFKSCHKWKSTLMSLYTFKSCWFNLNVLWINIIAPCQFPISDISKRWWNFLLFSLFPVLLIIKQSKCDFNKRNTLARWKQEQLWDNPYTFCTIWTNRISHT